MAKDHEAKEARLLSKLFAGMILALLIDIALYLRVHLPYKQVLHSEWINFTDFNVYYQMRPVLP